MPLKPEAGTDVTKLKSLLDDLCQNEPDFSYTTDPESGDVTIGGLSEAQFDHAIATLKVNGLQMEVGALVVAYRETVNKIVTKDYTHKSARHGDCKFARIIFDVFPVERDSGFHFENKSEGSNVPVQFIAGIEKGLMSVLQSGPLMGLPVVDIGVHLLDGAYHDEDSSPLAFEIAARAALRECLENVGALLQPIVKIVIVAPEEQIGAVIGDLHQRLAKVIDTFECDGQNNIVALVSLASMFGYRNTLRKLAGFEATFEITYSHYEIVPGGRNYDPDNFPPAIGMRA